MRRAPLVYLQMHAAGVARVLLDPGAVEYLRLTGRYPENGGLLAMAHEQGVVATLGLVRQARPVLFRLTLLLGAWLGAVLGAAAWGSVRLWRARRRAELLVLLTVASYFLVLSGGAHGLSRFRHPVVPVICILAGAALMGREPGGLPRRGRIGYKPAVATVPPRPPRTS